MKRVLTIVLVLFLFALLVTGALTVAVKLYLTDERIRSYVVAASESLLGRRVDLGAIKVSLFTGITLKDLRIKEKTSDESFLSAREFVLKYRLAPLLSKSLAIDEMRVSGAVVRVRKGADGRFNFSDIVGSGGAAEPPAAAPNLPFALQVRSIVLKDVLIDFAEPAGQLSEARIRIDADLGLSSRSARVISSKGKFRVTLDEALLKGHPRPLRNIASQGTYKVSLDLAARRADILEVDAGIARTPVTANGYVAYGDPLSFSLDLGAPEIKLAMLQKAFAPLLPEGTGFDGLASLSVSAQKPSSPGSNMSFKGQLTMKNVGLSSKGYRPVLTGTIGFTPEDITFNNILIVMGENSLDVSGRIKNYSREPDLSLDVKAGSLNLDAIASAGESRASENAGVPSSPATGREEFEPMTKVKLLAAGSVAIDKMLLKGVAVQNLKATFAFRNNILAIPSMIGNTMSGNFKCRSTIDLSRRGTAYTLNADIKGVGLEDITQAFAPKARDTLYGSLYGKMDLAGSGTLEENIKNNLNGRGSFTVKNGKIRNARISSGLLGFLGLQDMQEIPIDKAEGAFTIAHRIMRLRSMITSTDLKIDEKGTIGMDERLDLHVMVKASKKLAPRMLGQSSVSQFLSRERGWTGVPLRVRGTIREPSYSVDMEYIRATAVKRLREKAEEELFKALAGDKGKQGQTGSEEQKKGVAPEDLLKDIFGK